MKSILVINTGSTSTKVALFEDTAMVFKETIEIPPEKLAGITRASQQTVFRVQDVQTVIGKHNVDVSGLDMIAARGGMLPRIRGGAYIVDDYLLKVSKYAPLTQHESSLSCIIASEIGKPYGIPCIIYDATNSNDANEYASITGYPDIKTTISGHPLNARMAARTVSEQLGIKYEQGNFIVAHLGGSISIGAHAKGKIVDMLNAFSGPMSPQRAGRLPTNHLIKLCYSGKYSYDELTRILNGRSGFMAYFGTQDSRVIFNRYREGDKEVKLIVEVMAYQVSKGIAEMRIALNDKCDAIILTGGMAYADEFVDLVSERVSFIAPVYVSPGEKEMEALAGGALRVLNHEEEAKLYRSVPDGYESQKAFLASVFEMEESYGF